ncbi:MAG: dual specificity protein phosphatase family protein [Myxococcota bacterium]|nr:dual specificity protein phosphatase family protein [Myxococcota bacterium]
MKYLAEVVAVLLALSAQWLWLLGWYVLACLLCGLSFLSVGPAIFNKSETGQIPPLRMFILAPWRWLYMCTVGLQRLRRREAATEVSPGLWLSRRLRPSELPAGVRLVVDLCAESPRMEGLASEVDYLCLPTLDGCPPAREAFERLVASVNEHPGPVLIHCAHGHGRSATLMVAVLVRRGVVPDPETAYALLREKRPGVYLHSGQRRLVNLRK